MSNRPIDSEQEEIEVHFNSCTPMTVICHKGVFQQLVDGAKNPLDPSPIKGQNYVQFDLQIDDATKRRINWAYTSDQTDHGFLTVDVVPAPGVANPLDELRAEVAQLKARLASQK